MKYPVKCAVCKKVIVENEEQYDEYPTELIESDNLNGYICESCKDDLYFCIECGDYDIELVPCAGDLVCESCKRSYDREQTDRREASNFLRRMI